MGTNRFDWSDVERHRALLTVVARAMLRSAWPVKGKLNASDVVQETMLKAHRAFEQFEGRTEQELVVWLKRILGNAMCDAIRRFTRAKRDAGLEERVRDSVDQSEGRFGAVLAASITSPSEKVARAEVACRMATALMDLREDQRMALELHYMDGRTVGETAELMGRTAASVAGLIRRGLKALRATLGDRAELGLSP